MRILVIGADPAGMSAASQIRRREPSWTVEAFDLGDFSSYALCGIPYFVGGLVGNIDQLVSISPERFERERGIKMHMRHEVLSVSPAKKSLTVKDLSTGQVRSESYDQLVMATGAEPVIPPGLDADLPGVFHIRGLQDALDIRAFMAERKPKTAILIGAGAIGLEMAENLSAAGLSVIMFGREPAAVFEPEIQNLVTLALGRPEVEFRRGVDAVGLEQTSDGRLKVKASQGDDAVGDLVIVAVGVRPRSQLAEAAGLTLGAKKAVAVDRHQRTSSPFIYSAGDCAESFHLVSKKPVHLPLALGANRQGRVAGLNICGRPEKSPGVLGTAILKTFDLGLARTGLGLREAQEAGFTQAVKTVVKQHSKPGYYPGAGAVTVIIIHDKSTGRVLGGQLAGTVDGVGQRVNTLACAITAGMTVKDVAALDTAYAPPFAPVYDPVVIACEVAAK